MNLMMISAVVGIFVCLTFIFLQIIGAIRSWRWRRLQAERDRALRAYQKRWIYWGDLTNLKAK